MVDVTIHNLEFRRKAFSLSVPSLTIKAGEKVALMGENGCGKSTLIHLLTGLIEAPAGAITYQQQPLESLSHEARARRFSVLTQFSDISFPFSVLEVAMLGRYIHLSGNNYQALDKQKTLERLKLLDLDQYQTRRYGDLSGGEQRRVMLARVLNQDAPIVYLDEPNSSLDIRHTLEIFDHLQQLPHTVITSVHDINLAHRYFERFLFFKQGKLIYDVLRHQVTPQLLSEVYDVKVSADTASFSFGS
ncbi:ABC transporter ATP-binding protein [Vibrio rarus]|uniref:ABC transporter ATP-binding protein n=1 Tax=Vibrio rarus TaxID=413403 RepID=UPI0021C34561|nr:ABC transporter ATP-binding protein [Vibrio rarus]